MSNILAEHDPADLGDLEREVMNLVWQEPEITAEEVREKLSRPLKESTVRTVLRRLSEKGYVKYSVENRTFRYRPAEARQQVAARAVKKIVDWFCQGSVEELLTGMVDSKVINQKELQALAGKIAKARGGNK
ncbi:MAG: BlaI/MecI/CopY family transcriptional regulator [Acidobacteria bacterium]|nr:BlaI/MecI/CopY family transcriptional regulator [Acidobacteriota bacterium]MBV9484246.1 BlaI/MecI/CopY family transcriptional regulator [Acidobacteriota bacterium]